MTMKINFQLRSKLSRLIHKGEEVVVIDEEGVNIIVRAVRGVNFLAGILRLL